MNTTPFCNGDGQPAPASLEDCLMLVIDPRVDRTRMHNLGDILVIAVCCMLCGGESFYDMEDFGLAKEAWLRTFLDLPNGIPSHDTFNRVFAALDPAKFNACFLKWTEGLRKTISGDIVSLDGKALRRAAGGAGIPFIVNAWSSTNGIVLGQVKVVDKSNEITAVPELLDALLLKGCIVTLDAMGCQRKTAAKIADAGADYVISLKGNQGTLHDEVKAFLEDVASRAPQELDRFETSRRGTGASRRGSASRARAWAGSPARTSGRASKACSWSTPPAKSKASPRPTGASSYPPCPSTPAGRSRPAARTGTSRTSCTGGWTSSSTRTSAGPERRTQPRTSPSCGASL